MSTVSDRLTKQPLLPVVTITKNDATTYTFNHFTGTYDFRLGYLSVSPPFDTVGGKFTMKITSSDGSNSNMNTILNNVKAGNEVVIWIGKSDATKTKLFRGIIEKKRISEPNKNYMDVTFSGPDWGSDLLKNRVIDYQWMKRQTGTTDQNDTTITIKQIVIDALTKDACYPVHINGQGPTVQTQGLVVNSANINPLDVQISQFMANMEFIDDKLQELDDLGNSYHYVDPDKNFIMAQLNTSNTTQPAEILLTDDNNDSVATSWAATKVGLIYPYTEFTNDLETHHRRIFGLGADFPYVDQSSTTTTDSSTLYNTYIAQRFQPEYVELAELRLWVSRLGTPTENLVIEVRQERNSLPLGSTIRSVEKDKSFLDDIAAGTAQEVSLEIGEELEVSKNYWIILLKNGANGSNTFKWHHDNTDNNPSTSATSIDDVTWTATSTPNRFKYAFRTIRTDPLITDLRLHNLTATATHFHEDVVRKPDITRYQLLYRYMAAAYENQLKQKDIFRAKIYAPDTLLQTGQKVRIRKQQSGYTFDDNFILGQIDYVFESTEEQGVGTFYYDIEAVKFSEYT